MVVVRVRVLLVDVVGVEGLVEQYLSGGGVGDEGVAVGDEGLDLESGVLGADVELAGLARAVVVDHAVRGDGRAFGRGVQVLVECRWPAGRPLVESGPAAFPESSHVAFGACVVGGERVRSCLVARPVRLERAHAVER